jgi:hypothetical protein
VAPFVCSGTMAASYAIGARFRVQSPFPLPSLFNQLNSRFDSYVAPACNVHSAPPDANIKQYFPAYGGQWMSVSRQVAVRKLVDGALKTIADISPAQQLSTAGLAIDAADYGPLWSFGPAAQYAATEPAGGYAAIPRSKWNTLYPSVSGGALDAGPALGAYPGLTPYMMGVGVNFAAPTAGRASARGRRVLNIPLLRCPVVDGVATVLGIGQFFMTAKASATVLSAEFGGALKETAVAGPPELFQ